MPNVSGRAISARADFVRERFGADSWRDFELRLPPHLRAVLDRPVDPAGWYPMDVYAQLQRAVGEAFGNGDQAALLDELGAFAAERNCATMYGPPGRDPFEFFKHVARLHRQTFDFGQTTVVRRPGGCMIEIDYEGHASELICCSAIGFYRRCAEMNGGRNVRVAAQSCQARGGATCLFQVTWRKIRRTLNPPTSAR